MQIVTTVKVWDLVIRVFHWSLVIFFAIAYLTGDELDTVHAWSSYVIIALILFRLLYGFVGSKYARFSDFIKSPETVWTYIKQLLNRSPKHYLGHNPAAGWMVVLLLLSLAMSSWSGLKAYAEEGHGPLAATDFSVIQTADADGDDDHERNKNTVSDGEEYWEELHEISVNLTLLLIFIHVAGVIVSSWLHKENLVKAMLTGKKHLK